MLIEPISFYYDIQKISYISSTFNLDKMQTDKSTHYEFYPDGTIIRYDVPYKKKKHENVKKIIVSREIIKKYFCHVETLLKNADFVDRHVDDCSRKWIISYDGHREIIEEDFETKDHRRFEYEFYKFLKSVGMD